MGHECELYRGIPPERAPPHDAGHVHQGSDPRQTGAEKSLRMSNLQDPTERPNLRLDVQLEVEGKAFQVDFGWSSSIAADLNYSHVLKSP